MKLVWNELFEEVFDSAVLSPQYKLCYLLALGFLPTDVLYYLVAM